MRWCVSIGAVLVAGAMAGGDVAGIAAPNPSNQFGLHLAGKEADPSVDVELVLAVDVSYSMDMDELALQREGYAQAIISKEFLQALKTRPERQDFRDLFRMGGIERPEAHHSLAGDRRPGNGRCRRHRDPENADPPGVAHLDLGGDQFRHAAVRRESAPGHPARDRYFRRWPQQQRLAGRGRARCRGGEGRSSSTACRSW